jgi:hypothetical protein
MWRIRILQFGCLEDIDSFRQDSFADLWQQRAAKHQIDLSHGEQSLDVLCRRDQVKQSDWPLEFDQ